MMIRARGRGRVLGVAGILRAGGLACALGAGMIVTASAQTSTVTTDVPQGAIVRFLDKMSGESVDLRLVPGAAQQHDRLIITLGECRAPADNLAADAFAYLTIEDIQAIGSARAVFTGWMIASSPALSAMDHPRYDVWVLGCAIDAPSGT